MNISDVERLILINQFTILEEKNPQDSYYRQGREILESGYKVLYTEITNTLSKEMSEEDGEFVIDVLQMYRTLHDSYNNLEDKKDLKESDVVFKGFDGNEEGNHYSFAKYFVQDFKRFSEFENASFNSHSNKIPKYQRMLIEWRKLDRYDYDLTVEEINNIINA